MDHQDRRVSPAVDVVSDDDGMVCGDDMDLGDTPQKALPSSNRSAVSRESEDDDDDSLIGSQPFKAIVADQKTSLAAAKAATDSIATASSSDAKTAKVGSTGSSVTGKQVKPAVQTRASPATVGETLPIAKLQPSKQFLAPRQAFLRDLLLEKPSTLGANPPSCPLKAHYSGLEEYQYCLSYRIMAEAMASLQDDAKLPPRATMVVQHIETRPPFTTVTFSLRSDLANRMVEQDIVHVDKTDKPFDGFLGVISALESNQQDGQARVTIMFAFSQFDRRLCQRQTVMHFRHLNSIVTFMRQYEALMSLDSSVAALPYVLRLPPSKANGVFNPRTISSKYKTIVTAALAKKKTVLNPEQVEAIRTCLLTPLPIAAIHGPPGCGKTHTVKHLCDVALDALHNSSAKRVATVSIGKPTSKKLPGGGYKTETKIKAPTGKSVAQRDVILVCAPSNAAVDELMSRLLDIKVTVGGTSRAASVLRLGSEDRLTQSEVKDNSLNRRLRDRSEELRKASRTRDAQRSELEAKKRKAQAEVEFLEKQAGNLASMDRSAASDLQREIRELKQKMSSWDVTIANIREKQNEERRTRVVDQKEYEKQLLTSADIICCTLSGSALEVLRSLDRPIALTVIDEAGQCVEPDVLTPLLHKPGHVIMIGDHLQLSATVLHPCNRKDYAVSLFESLRDTLTAAGALVQLKEQYRMDPNICKLASDAFYDGSLRSAPAVLRRSLPQWRRRVLNSSVFRSDIQGMERGSRSFSNVREALEVRAIVEKLGGVAEEPLSGKIAIITPYADQVGLIKSKLLDLSQEILKHVSVNTVDAYQGQERDIIIFSCVRTRHIGFLADKRRLNVALTRARRMLFVVGDLTWLEKQHPVWKTIVADMRRLQSVDALMQLPMRYKGSLSRVYWREGEDEPVVTDDTRRQSSDQSLERSSLTDRDVRRSPFNDRRGSAERRPSYDARSRSRDPVERNTRRDSYDRDRDRRSFGTAPDRLSRRRSPPRTNYGRHSRSPPRRPPPRPRTPPLRSYGKRPATASSLTEQTDRNGAEPLQKQAKAMPRDPRLARAQERIGSSNSTNKPSAADAPPEFVFRNTDASGSAFRQTFVPAEPAPRARAGLQGRPSGGPVYKKTLDKAKMKSDPCSALFDSQ
eukprot:TRINITY_DN12439_c0_g2_i1.p1 TRINITY_DN12439_c0_g2~~TRINITY_DN12439_c0_g2_i1.p1  ORF type:complete len:1308 (+),score=248.40 TRINITY_DN12439_c0_g2_i1:502-3924(+)